MQVEIDEFERCASELNTEGRGDEARTYLVRTSSAPVGEHDQPSVPLVSVVICTRNRPDRIGNAVTSVVRNSYPRFMLTVVDQSTTGETAAIVSKMGHDDPRVQLIIDKGAGLSRAYNIGIRASTGDILAFTDDDCIVPDNWITSVVDAFTANQDADLLYGQVKPASDPTGEGTIGQLTPLLKFETPQRLSRRDGFRVFGMGANFAARSRLFATVGMFDEALGGGGPLRSSQDFDLAYRAYRAGSVILLRPEVTLLHDGHRDVEDWPALLRNYGVGDGAFYAKHVRCRDLLALRLMLERVARKSAKTIAGRALGRHPEEPYYLRGFFAGIRAGSRYQVDRSARLYRMPTTEAAPPTTS